MDEEIHDKPSQVDAEGGVVCVRGPDGVDVQMTPDAADETSHRMFHGALKARGQRLANEGRGKK
jgi:hypothetical protein